MPIVCCIFASDGMPSAFNEVISLLQKQRAAIDKAIAALQQVGDEGFEEPEASTPPAKKTGKKAATKKTARKRTLSPDARKRISDAVRKRWAAAKKGSKKQATKKTK